MSYYSSSGASDHRYYDVSQPVWGLRAAAGFGDIPTQSIRGLGCGSASSHPLAQGMGCIDGPMYGPDGTRLKGSCGMGDIPTQSIRGVGEYMLRGLGSLFGLGAADSDAYVPPGYEYRDDAWWQSVAGMFAQQGVPDALIQAGQFCLFTDLGMANVNAFAVVQMWGSAGWFVMHQYQSGGCIDPTNTRVFRIAPADIKKWQGVPGVRILAMPNHAKPTVGEWSKYGLGPAAEQPVVQPGQTQPVPSLPGTIPTIPFNLPTCADGQSLNLMTMQCVDGKAPTPPPGPPPPATPPTDAEKDSVATPLLIVAGVAIAIAFLLNRRSSSSDSYSLRSRYPLGTSVDVDTSGFGKGEVRYPFGYPGPGPDLDHSPPVRGLSMPIPQGGIFGGGDGGGSDGLLGQIFGRVQQAAVGYANTVAQAIVPWIQQVGKSVISRAAPMLAAGQPCECRAKHQGQLHRCSGQAALLCETCRRRVCMGHAFVSWRADAVCWECVEALCRARGVNAPSSDTPSSGGHAVDGDTVQLDRDRKAAYAILELEDGDSMKAVKAAHRKLAARYHPDGPEPDEGKVKKVNAAYHFLLEHLSKRSAG